MTSNQAQRFAGKVAFVTGATSGIGLATAMAFTREGASVVVADIAEKGVQETARLIEELGSSALAITCDVRKAEDVKAAVDKAVAAFGRIDADFNNAGVEQPYGAIADLTEDDWDRIVAINLRGVFLCMKYVVPVMLKQGGGAALALFACLAAGAYAQQGGTVPKLVYDSQTRGPVPIPPSERGLQTVGAETWFKVSDQALELEGPCFERDGNLLFSDVTGGHVFRLKPDKRISTVVGKKELGPGGLAVHKDGRIFIAVVGDLKGAGSIVAVKPDGSDMQTIVPPQAG